MQEAYGQVIRQGQFIDRQYPVFDEQAIAHHSIERITVKLLAKPSMKPIADKGERIIYTFDAQGRMTGFRHVFPRQSGKLDTMRRVFFYQGDDLVMRTEISGSYRRRVTYERQDDHITRQRTEIKRGTQEWQLLDIEKIEKHISDSDSGRVLAESVGGLNSKPYQHSVTVFDKQGAPTGRKVWNGPRLQSSEYWQYRDGHLAAYGFQHVNDTYPVSLTYVIKDDRHDTGTWCTGGNCMNWSMVYYPNGLPKGWIFIDPETEDMKVWEFEFGYRNE